MSRGAGYLNRDGKFCCLGVLCDISGVFEWRAIEGDNVYGTKYNTLPTEVRDWAGMDNVAGEFDGTSLWGLNDDGTPFTEIADIIEKNWEKL